MKLLFAILSLFGVVSFSNFNTFNNDADESQEVFKHERNYQHTENVGNTTVTYKYESNAVNSNDDLIIGNVYELGVYGRGLDDMFYSETGYVFFELLTSLETGDYLEFSNGYDLDSDIFDGIYLLLTYSYGIYVYYSEIQYYNFDPSIDYYYDVVFENNAVIRLLDYNAIKFSYLHYTDYNVIESVEYVAPTTVIGVINNFCTDYLFKDIPYVNEITFTVGGESISLMTYLVIITGIILSAGLLILLIFIFKWLFLMFAGLFKVK